MRRLTNPLALAACLSLLSMQLSGVHVHADDSGYVGVPEASFTHSHGHHVHDNEHHGGNAKVDHGHRGDSAPAHDYEHAKDVSVPDLALGTFKLPLAIPAPILLFTEFPAIRTLASTDFVFPVLSGRHTRWRPPLRAPPQPS
jgi:hypothetical protein